MSSPGPLALSACVRAGWPAASQGKDLVAWVQLRRRGSISGASHCRALFPPAGCPLPLRRRCWHAECMHPACSRSYKNLWGANQPQSLDDQHKSPTVRSDLGEHLGSWRLDWEEDGRYVEWRRDREEQPEGEKARVQKEWTRFRQSSGRNNAKLWETHEEFGRSGFDRGSQKWWRQRYYDYEFAGGGGVRTMEAVHESLRVLGVTDAGDAPAIRAAYLRLVGKWHPDKFQKEEDKVNATKHFREVSDAYNILRKT